MSFRTKRQQKLQYILLLLELLTSFIKQNLNRDHVFFQECLLWQKLKTVFPEAP